MRHSILIMGLALGLAWGQAQTFVENADDCAFALPEGVVLGENVRCGVLNVPENRQSESPDISLPVLVVESEADNDEDALVLLNGGPGQPAQELLSAFFGSPAGGALSAERDVIFFEQRGTGFAEPALACDAELNVLAEDPAYQVANIIEETQLETAALQTCGERLSAEGIDLSAYNTQESAADVAALAEALGYEQLSLFGTSYGSRLALNVARKYPEILRSMVLTSVAPPDYPIGSVPAYAEEVLVSLSADCAADEMCSATYPDLDSVFTEVYDTLESTPLMLESGVLFGGESLIASLYELLYGASGETSIPALIYALREGEDEATRAFLSKVLNSEEARGDLQRHGMKTSVNCADEKPFMSEYASLNAVARAELRSLSVISESQFGDLCANWPTAELPTEHFEPVTSSVPTLIISGTYDIATPPSLARATAEALGNATLVELRGLGHNTLNRAGECGFALMLGFLSTPESELNTACSTEFEPGFTQRLGD